MTATFRNNAALLAEILNICAFEIEAIKNRSNIFPVCFFQPITIAQMSHFSKNGGNALGISSDDGPLICKLAILYLRQHNALHNRPQVLSVVLVFAVTIQWSAADDDEEVYRTAQAILDRAVALAKCKGLDHRYIYQNYAASSQDFLGSYGARNKARLLRIQELYDPGKVFVDLQPGYFKLRQSADGIRAQ